MKSAVVFDLLGKSIQDAEGAALAQKAKGVYLFEVSSGSDKQFWCLDLNKRTMTTGESKADVRIVVTDDNFMAMTNGVLNPQQAFMQGKVKLVGNMMLALKLQAVLNSARDLAGKMGIDLKTIGTDASSAAPAAAPAGGKAPATGLKSQFVFDSIQNSIVQEGQKLVSQVKAVLHFVVDGTVVAVDLKSGSGAISVGKDGAPKADLTVTITDENLVKVANGTLSPQMAFARGAIKARGNMSLLMKLGKVLKPAPKSKL